MTNTKTYRRTRIRKRIKKVISGTPDYPRLSVFRSNKEIYCQVIDDVNGKTLLQTSSRDKVITDLKLKSNIEVSFNVGKSVAEHALKKGIEKTEFKTPNCPIYQNFTSDPVKNPSIIKSNLLSQLTGAVLWTQSVNKMINDGVKEFYEVGPGNILQGLIRKIDNDITVGKI